MTILVSILLVTGLIGSIAFSIVYREEIKDYFKELKEDVA